MKQYMCDYCEMVESDWNFIGDYEHDHTLCDLCFANLDPEHQLEYEPLLNRDYSEYEV